MSGEEHKNGDITDGAVKGKGKKGKKGKVEVCYMILYSLPVPSSKPIKLQIIILYFCYFIYFEQS